MTIDDLRRKPGHLIRRVQQISAAIFSDELARDELTSVQFASLVVIARRPGLDATGVSSLIAYDRATIGGVLDRLEAKKLIRREASSDDRRVKRLFATSQGARALAALAPSVDRVQDRLLAPLDAAERVQFLTLLERLVAAHGPIVPVESITDRRSRGRALGGDAEQDG